jgi:DNA-binding LacI/PurR family transcriptional regulator
MSTAHPARRPATSVDVARRAGVSRSTVSSILNDRGADRFPEQTRRKVLEAAGALDYRPSQAGRSLAKGHSDTILVLLPVTTWGGNLQDAVEHFMVDTTALGANVVVRFAGNTQKSALSAILALRPIGVVDLAGLSYDEREYLEGQGVICVPTRRERGSDGQDGGVAELQAAALLAKGPRQLWFAALSDERLDPYGALRYAALDDFCARHAVRAPRRVDVPLSLAGAVAALTEILASPRPAGIACYNDDVALALLAAARKLKIQVPAEVSVVGVDHTPLGQLWSPRLTTVKVDMASFVRAVALDLRARIDGDEVADGAAPVPYVTLVAGETI